MAGDVHQPLPDTYFGRTYSLAWRSVARLTRPPSHSRRAEARRAQARHWLLLAAIFAVAITALMFTLDARIILAMPPRGTASLWPLRILTEFGKASYILWGLFGLMIAVLLIAPLLRGRGAAMAIGLGTRIQFLFLSVLTPMLAGEVLKGVVGRARPFVGGHADPFHYSHFAWTEAYASFPSGHATAAFALAFAVSAIWPRLRGVMWLYAIVIALTRIALLAHHPSDVVGGALVGVVGAMAVRYWFATRRVLFMINSDGAISPRAGPTFQHLKGVARNIAAS
jgi:undecaprenyl-diphosphatase